VLIQYPDWLQARTNVPLPHIRIFHFKLPRSENWVPEWVLLSHAPQPRMYVSC